VKRAKSTVMARPDEALQGLPEPLPSGEALLWQGAPDFAALARSAFHTNLLLGYFGALLALRAATVWSSTGSALAACIAAMWLSPLFLLAIGMVFTLAWLTSRSTVYTITTRRVVMHIGLVLDLTLNLPFDALDSVDLHLASDGTGDLPLRISASSKIAYLHLWPHARPWRLRHPEPMLRAVPEAALVGELLADALCAVAPAEQTTVFRPRKEIESADMSDFPIATAS
jgi:hypothetical protein